MPVGTCVFDGGGGQGAVPATAIIRPPQLYHTVPATAIIRPLLHYQTVPATAIIRQLLLYHTVPASAIITRYCSIALWLRLPTACLSAVPSSY